MDWVFSILSPIWDAIGALILAGGGGAIVAVAAIRFFGESWLNHRFATKMATFTHQQDEQLERLRFKINALFDRRTRLHQREFEIIPEVWHALVAAHHEMAAFTSDFKQYPDLARLSAPELDEYLSGTGFSDGDKRRIREAGDRNAVVQEIFHYRNKMTSHNALFDAQQIFLKNGIFIEPNLRGKFDELVRLLRHAHVEYSINVEQKVRPLMRDATKALGERGKLLLDEIRDDLQVRLWSPDELDGGAAAK